MRIFIPLLIILSIAFSNTVMALTPPEPTSKDVEISGMVTFEGKPVPDMQIDLIWNSCEFFGSDIYYLNNSDKMIAKTDKNGRYQFIFPVIHSYSLNILVNGYGTGLKAKLYSTDCIEGAINFSKNKKTVYNVVLNKISLIEKKCDANGGLYAYNFNADTRQVERVCKMYFSDEGKACVDGSECQSKICEGDIDSNDKIIGKCIGSINMNTGLSIDSIDRYMEKGKLYNNDGTLYVKQPNCNEICASFPDAKTVNADVSNCATVPEQNKVLWELPW